MGLMTGDVSINPNASCVVMTTEILRSMLYRCAPSCNQTLSTAHLFGLSEASQTRLDCIVPMYAGALGHETVKHQVGVLRAW